MELFFKGVYSYILKTEDFHDIKKIGGANGHDLISMFNSVLTLLRKCNYIDDSHRSIVLSCFSNLVNPLGEILKLSEDRNATIIFRYGESKNVIQHSFIKDTNNKSMDVKQINEMFLSMRKSIKLVVSFLNSNEHEYIK